MANAGRSSDRGGTGTEPVDTGRETATEQRPHGKPAATPEVRRPPTPDTQPSEDEREGATEDEINDRDSVGVGYDQEPERDKGEPGVS